MKDNVAEKVLMMLSGDGLSLSYTSTRLLYARFIVSFTEYICIYDSHRELMHT